MKRIDWSRYVPLGIDSKQVRTMLLLALAAGVAVSLGFLFRYSQAKEALYEYEPITRQRILIAGAVMPDFVQLLRGSFWGLAAVAACMPAVALGFYLCHYQGGRSIYTMRRLPDRWELWRRCLALPLLTMASCLILAALFTLLYLELYLLATPDVCLTPDQWQKLWRG